MPQDASRCLKRPRIPGARFPLSWSFSVLGGAMGHGVEILNMLGEGKHCNFPLDKLQTIAVRNKAWLRYRGSFEIFEGVIWCFRCVMMTHHDTSTPIVVAIKVQSTVTIITSSRNHRFLGSPWRHETVMAMLAERRLASSGYAVQLP